MLSANEMSNENDSSSDVEILSVNYNGRDIPRPTASNVPQIATIKAHIVIPDSDEEGSISSKSSTGLPRITRDKLNVSSPNSPNAPRLNALKPPKVGPGVARRLLSSDSPIKSPEVKRRRLKVRESSEEAPEPSVVPDTLKMLRGIFPKMPEHVLVDATNKFGDNFPAALAWITATKGSMEMQEPESPADDDLEEMEEKVKAGLLRHGKPSPAPKGPDSAKKVIVRERALKDEYEDEEDPEQEMARLLKQIDDIAIECEEIGKELEHVLQKPTTISQPSNLTDEMQLKPYQLKGLEWLITLHEKKHSAILADEMGLGKTATTISFLAQLTLNGAKGPFLVVVPTSVLDNWEREMDMWLGEDTFDFYQYHGSVMEREDIRDALLAELKHAERPICVITTYNIASGNSDDRKFMRKLKPQVLVLDEGHNVKNADSQRFYQLNRIPAKFRLILTGTPLQNNLKELLSLLAFIMPSKFGGEDNLTSIQELFDSADVSLEHRLVRAQRMMAPFVLRRRKADVLKDLPPKHRKIEEVDMTATQIQIYEEYMEKALNPVQDEDQKSVYNNLMMLRKAALHPLLFRRHYSNENQLLQMSKDFLKEKVFAEKNSEAIYYDLLVMSDFEIYNLCSKYPKHLGKYTLPTELLYDAGKVPALIKLIREYQAKGEKILVFSQFVLVLNLLEAILNLEDIKFLRLDGSTKAAERQKLIDEFNGDDCDAKVFVLSTKAGGLGINLSTANLVIMFDSDFNPHNDAQAEDRAHRVGQTRDVTVVKLVSKHSIEEHILRICDQKLKLEEQLKEAEAMELSSTRPDDGDDPVDVLNCMQALREEWKRRKM